MAMSRLSWSAPFANFWSSSPSPGPGAGPPSSSASSSALTSTSTSPLQTSQIPSTQISQAQAQAPAPFPSFPSHPSTNTRQSQHAQRTHQQHRQRLHSHFVTVPPRIEENVTEAMSASLGRDGGGVAETVAVLTSTRRRHNATPRIGEAEDAVARSVERERDREREREPIMESRRPTTHPVPIRPNTTTAVERRVASPVPKMEISSSPRHVLPSTTTANNAASNATQNVISERETRYKRERDEYRRRCAEFDRGLSELQNKLHELQMHNRRLEQALDTEARSKTDLIDDLARKRTYCESLGSAKADSERKLLDAKLLERKLKTEVERERENSRRIGGERDRVRMELDEVRAELEMLRLREQEREREKGRERRKRERERDRDDEGDYVKELQAARDELARAEKQHEVTRRLLEEKAEELKGVQLFASRADEVSIADVISLVNSLNAEILQAAAFIADSLHFSNAPSEQVPQQEVSKATKAVVNGLGQDMAKAVWGLRSSRSRRDQEHEYDPTVVQYALQVAMTGFCERVINDWAPNPEANQWLESIYGTIQTKESQSVAGRWRALTRGQLGGAKDPSFIIKHLVDRLVNILVVAGCSKSQVQAENFQEKFHDYLAAIANVTVRVQTAAGEAITSVDIRTYSCAAGENFTREYMEDTYSDGSSRDIGKPIAGTTELGLLKKERKVAGQAEAEYTPLVKAKVVLAAVLRE